MARRQSAKPSVWRVRVASFGCASLYSKVMLRLGCIIGLHIVRSGKMARSSNSRKALPNPSVNADAPVRTYDLANVCGRATVTLFR